MVTYNLSVSDNTLTAGGTNDIINIGIGDNTVNAGGGNDVINVDGSVFFDAGDILDFTNQDGAGTVTVPNSGEVTLDGNLWKGVSGDFKITADTVLTFEYMSTLESEIGMVGFDSNLAWNGGGGTAEEYFQTYGTQTNVASINQGTGFSYSGSGNWEVMTINVGDYITGNFDYFALVNDHDNGTVGNSSFRNIKLVDTGIYSNVLNGGAGDDLITSGNGHDTIDGGADNDTIYGGGGDDIITGGTGDDLIYSQSSSAPSSTLLTIEAEDYDSIRAGVGHEWTTEARAGASNDTVVRVDNNGGNNHFIGRLDEAPELTYSVTFDSAGTYYIWMRGYGPNGSDDSAYVGLDGTLLTNAGGMTFGNPSWSGSTWTGGTFRIEFTITEAGTHTINLWPREDGISIDKILITDDINYTPTGLGPSESAATIDGEDGDDTIFGGNGADTIDGGDDDDTIFGGNGIDTINGGDGADTIDGGASNDMLDGGTGNDVVDGGAGADDLDGEAGADTLDGGDGDDTVDGGAGDDTVQGGSGEDVVNGGDGDDFIVDVDIYGSTGFDADADAEDALHGGAGDDILVATSGADQMYGDGGADIFVFTPYDTVTEARVYDFQQGTDLLYLIDLTPTYQVDVNYIFEFNSLNISVIGGNTHITFANGSDIQIDGVTNLTEADFDGQHFF